MRAQILGGLDRLADPSPTALADLWISTCGARAAALGVDGSLERFDLDAARPLDRGWLPGRIYAATPGLEQFAVVNERGLSGLSRLLTAQMPRLRPAQVRARGLATIGW